MARPLYRSACLQAAKLDPDGHAGLWFDKFCDRWRVTGSSWTMSADGSGGSPKLAWIETILDATVGVRDQIEESAFRLLRLVEARGGRFAVFVTESRFVAGLGRSHPVENGFVWHPTLGTPFLPGSSVKGLVRAWAEEEDGADKETVARLLGASSRVGAICFLDAVPTKPVTLEADVMTPHYAGWDANNPPGDWCSPNPIPFLATAAQTPFLFGVLPRCKTSDADLDRVVSWLTSALTWAGAGAKTSVGYGRMVRDDTATSELWEQARRQVQTQEQRRREQERIASLSPLERELEEIAQQRKDLPRYLAWLKALEAGCCADKPDTQAAVASLIKEEMQKSGKWKPMSAKKRPEKDKDHQRSLAVERFIKR